MKLQYENNPLFHKFIKQAVALSSLPLEDLETGFNWLKDNFSFDDPQLETLKDDFLKTLSTWGSTDNYTNIEKKLKQDYFTLVINSNFGRFKLG